MKDRCIALAGLAQAISLARSVADTGTAPATPLDTSLQSILRIDADTPAGVYGGVGGVQHGLRTLLAQLDGTARDPAVLRMGFAVLSVERRLAARRDLLGALHDGIVATGPLVAQSGTTSPVVLARLGQLYASTVSTLTPRVLVQGNPVYLGNDAIVSEIRAILLAAVRSAVLWRQLGGSYWDFALRRRHIADTARALLQA